MDMASLVAGFKARIHILLPKYEYCATLFEGPFQSPHAYGTDCFSLYARRPQLNCAYLQAFAPQKTGFPLSQDVRSPVSPRAGLGG